MTDYSVAHSTVCTFSSGLQLWWVDDCFVNRGDEFTVSEFLPIDGVDRWELPEGESTSKNVLITLKAVSNVEKVTFCVCSHEYAKKYWHEINKTNCIVLIDIGYEGQTEFGQADGDDFYGILFYLDRMREGRIYAEVAFLTIDITRVERYMEEKQEWIAAKPIDKTGSVDKRVHSLVKFCRARQPLRASELTLKVWRQLRAAALEFYEAKGINPFCMHHEKRGGDAPDIRQRKKGIVAELRTRLTKEAPALDTFDLFEWNEQAIGQIRGWNLPPIRAIGQFNNKGKDLTAVFHLISNYFQRNCAREDFNLDFCMSDKLDHDYLWFNACALAEGLVLLADNLNDEIKEKVEKRTFPKGRCRLIWRVYEDCDPARLIVEVCQRFYEWFGDDLTCVKVTEKAFPKDAKNRVAQAYQFFHEAGGVIEIDEGSGILKIQIKATERKLDGKDVWFV